MNELELGALMYFLHSGTVEAERTTRLWQLLPHADQQRWQEFGVNAVEHLAKHLPEKE